MVGHGHAIPLEVVATMIEMADVAWNALEHRRERRTLADGEEEIMDLKLENERLRGVLAENLAVFQKLTQISDLSKDCPSDLYERLEATVDSSSFLMKLESLQDKSNTVPRSNYSDTECTGLKDIDVSINFDGEPCRWIWVTKEMAADKLEEVSGIDNDNYVIISEDNVIDGIAEFIAKCIHENPKSKVLTPEQLQRSVVRALGGMKNKSKLRFVWEAGKVVYTISSLGLALAGLYHARPILKHARPVLKHTATGVSTVSKLVAKAL